MSTELKFYLGNSEKLSSQSFDAESFWLTPDDGKLYYDNGTTRKLIGSNLDTLTVNTINVAENVVVNSNITTDTLTATTGNIDNITSNDINVNQIKLGEDFSIDKDTKTIKYDYDGAPNNYILSPNGFSMGFMNEVILYDIAIGRNNTCKGNFNLTIGNSNNLYSSYSSAIGYSLNGSTSDDGSYSQGQLFIGRYNKTPESPSLFVVGNGDTSNGDNAFVVTESGRIILGEGSFTTSIDTVTDLEENALIFVVEEEA